MLKKIQKILSLMAVGMNYTETYTATGGSTAQMIQLNI